MLLLKIIKAGICKDVVSNAIKTSGIVLFHLIENDPEILQLSDRFTNSVRARVRVRVRVKVRVRVRVSFLYKGQGYGFANPSPNPNPLASALCLI